MEPSVWNFESKSFCSVWYFCVKGKTSSLEECSICQMTECPAIVITQKTQVKSELLLLCTGEKSGNFSMTHGIAWK